MRGDANQGLTRRGLKVLLCGIHNVWQEWMLDPQVNQKSEKMDSQSKSEEKKPSEVEEQKEENTIE